LDTVNIRYDANTLIAHYHPSKVQNECSITAFDSNPAAMLQSCLSPAVSGLSAALHEMMGKTQALKERATSSGRFKTILSLFIALPLMQKNTETRNLLPKSRPIHFMRQPLSNKTTAHCLSFQLFQTSRHTVTILIGETISKSVRKISLQVASGHGEVTCDSSIDMNNNKTDSEY
jgi:hypothetical protein